MRPCAGGAVTDYSVAAVRPISPSFSTCRYDSEKDLEIERLKVTKILLLVFMYIWFL